MATESSTSLTSTDLLRIDRGGMMTWESSGCAFQAVLRVSTDNQEVTEHAEQYNDEMDVDADMY